MLGRVPVGPMTLLRRPVQAVRYVRNREPEPRHDLAANSILSGRC